MIHEDLGKSMAVLNAARRGVTVYGIPWKSMLTFGAEAGWFAIRRSLRSGRGGSIPIARLALTLKFCLNIKIRRSRKKSGRALAGNCTSWWQNSDRGDVR
jgi:hypothetical protein